MFNYAKSLSNPIITSHKRTGDNNIKQAGSFVSMYISIDRRRNWVSFLAVSFSVHDTIASEKHFWVEAVVLLDYQRTFGHTKSSVTMLQGFYKLK